MKTYKMHFWLYDSRPAIDDFDCETMIVQARSEEEAHEAVKKRYPRARKIKVI